MRLLVLAFLGVLLSSMSQQISPNANHDTTAAIERIAVNDNRTAAGTLVDGVLTIRLEAREGMWHPDADVDPGTPVYIFAEAGKAAVNPGPLMRVPEGTEIRGSVRNTLSTRIVVHGLYTRGVPPGPNGDTMHVAAGAMREFRFAAGQAGTYFYWASTTDAPTAARIRQESQLGGAFIIDPRGTSGARTDRVMFISSWLDSLTVGTDTVVVSRIVINGKSWPHTERLTYGAGEEIHWRVINGNAPVHPMHLHGFYYRVHSRGNERIDSVYPPNSPAHMVVTERLPPGRTMTLSFKPDRAGNWIFHCHDNVHLQNGRALSGAPQPEQHRVQNHALEMMSGPVIGMFVRPEPGARAVADEPRRRLRLLVREDAGGTATEPSFGYVLEDAGVQRPASGPLLPGPTIVLRRGEGVSINVVNELAEATAVHWHGIELDSYFDGVAGFGGMPGRISPPVAARDSFEARFTPPRAGTFIYHAHADEVRQQKAGLAGALIVIEPGSSYDADTDIPLLITVPRLRADAAAVLLNGTSTPALKQMRIGTRYRLRLINVHTSRPSMIASLLDPSGSPLTWRALAKDGYDLDPSRAVSSPAVQQMGNGETYDFEFVPTAPGDLKFEVRSAGQQLLVTLPIQVVR